VGSTRRGALDGMEAAVDMTRRASRRAVSHHDREVAELAADPELAVGYSKGGD
jgi:hypothetical protein